MVTDSGDGKDSSSFVSEYLASRQVFKKLKKHTDQIKPIRPNPILVWAVHLRQLTILILVLYFSTYPSYKTT
jgi:hypothetical protein